MEKKKVAELRRASQLQKKKELSEQMYTKCLYRAPGADGQT